MKKSNILWLVVSIIMIFAITLVSADSCTTTPIPSATNPMVVSANPVNLAQNVPVSTIVTATFNEAMDPSTINTATFTLKQGQKPVLGTVTYAGKTATFTPANYLESCTIYTATITTGAKDPTGNALASDYVWNFTTPCAAGYGPGQVQVGGGSKAGGVDGASGAGIFGGGGGNPGLFNTYTLTYTAGAGGSITAPATSPTTHNSGGIVTITAVANSGYHFVNWTGDVSTVASANAASTTITMNGNYAITANFANTVDLGSADSFAILADSGITNTGTTTINGDVGTHPTATETGFGPGANSVTLTGTNHAGDSITVQAKIDLVTAYNDAAGRTPTIVGTELGGTTPAPGVYKSGAGTFGLTDTLYLTGDENAVWIFQTATTLTTAGSSHVNLSGGAKAANIYWVVGSSATLGTNSTFSGTIMALESITLTTGAILDGRALARNGAVTLDANTITKPAP